jgi:hypothetical protein
VQVFLREPLGFLVGVPLLTHQLGYVNILPMYAVMLFAAPAMLWLALRRPWALAGLSAALWFLTGLFEWNMPAFPNPGGWFFNPLAWQIIFVTGLLTGVAMRQGRRLVPVGAVAGRGRSAAGAGLGARARCGRHAQPPDVAGQSERR